MVERQIKYLQMDDRNLNIKELKVLLDRPDALPEGTWKYNKETKLWHIQVTFDTEHED